MNKFITAKETGERLRKLRGSRRQGSCSFSCAIFIAAIAIGSALFAASVAVFIS